MTRGNVPDLGLVDYSRQQAMDQELSYLRKQNVHVVIGCGGVGFWVGLFLAMNGCKKFTLIEGQTIEASNLNRLPVPVHYTGLNKAVALKRLIKTLRPECIVSILPAHLTENTLGLLRKVADPGNTTFWDCTDDARIQTKIYAEIQKIRTEFSNITYRKIGYEGFKVGTYANFDIWFSNEATYQPGYRTTSANAMSSALAAIIGIFAQGMNQTADVKLDMQDIIWAPPSEQVDEDDSDDEDEEEDE